MGERQILPWHTKSIFIISYISLHKPANPWLDSDKELIEIINCRLTVSGAEKVRKSEMLNRCFPNLFRLRLSVHFADVQNL